MLPAGNRLRKKRDFEHVFSSKSSLSGRFFRLIIINNNLPISRVGVVVSSKVSKKAVVRNKIRRRVYSFIRPYLKTLQPSLDIVVLISKNAITSTAQEFKFDLTNSLSKIR